MTGHPEPPRFTRAPETRRDRFIRRAMLVPRWTAVALFWISGRWERTALFCLVIFMVVLWSGWTG